MITIYAALGFTLFGAFAGVLLTIRWWYGAMRKPGAIRTFIVSIRQAAHAQANTSVLREMYRGADGSDDTCPFCDLPVAVGLREPVPYIPPGHIRSIVDRSYREVVPITEEEMESMKTLSSMMGQYPLPHSTAKKEQEP